MKTAKEVYHYFFKESPLEIELFDVEDDSRKVKPGTIFIAIEKGNIDEVITMMIRGVE